MTDFNNLKTPIFPNINDLPREATAELASNGSDLVHKLNSVVDEVDRISQSLSAGEPVKRSLYIDSSNGSDGNSGVDENNSVKTTGKLIEILASGSLDNDIAIYWKTDTPEQLDFASVTTNKDITIEIIFVESESSIDYSLSESLIINSLSNIKIVIKNGKFDVETILLLSEIGNLSLENNQFTAKSNYNSTLVKIENCNQLTLDNNILTGSTSPSFSKNLLLLNNCTVSNIFTNTFQTSIEKAVESNNSYVILNKSLNIQNIFNSSNLVWISLTNSTLEILDDKQISPANIQTVNTKIINKLWQDIQKTYSWYFPYLEQGDVTLFPAWKKNAHFKSLHFNSRDNDIGFDLKVNDNAVGTSSESLTEKIFQLSNQFNQTSSISESKIELYLSKEAYELTVQLEVFEY